MSKKEKDGLDQLLELITSDHEQKSELSDSRKQYIENLVMGSYDKKYSKRDSRSVFVQKIFDNYRIYIGSLAAVAVLVVVMVISRPTSDLRITSDQELVPRELDLQESITEDSVSSLSSPDMSSGSLVEERAITSVEKVSGDIDQVLASLDSEMTLIEAEIASAENFLGEISFDLEEGMVE